MYCHLKVEDSIWILTKYIVSSIYKTNFDIYFQIFYQLILEYSILSKYTSWANLYQEIDSILYQSFKILHKTL